MIKGKYNEVKNMDFLDYREKLGIGFNDDDKFHYFLNKIDNMIKVTDEKNSFFQVGVEEYYTFCNLTGTKTEIDLLYVSTEPFVSIDKYNVRRYRCCLNIFGRHQSYLEEYLSYYIAFANSLPVEDKQRIDRKTAINILTNMLDESHISFEVLKDNEEYFVFPKGAKELDDALVSEPLRWLESYPKAHSTFCRALKQYADGEHTRDVADNLRKALEEFLQEYLENNKNLETNKNEVCKFLGEKGVDAEFCSMLHSLLNTYKTINDKYAKHHDALDKKLLEFIMYQTGVFIRMLISVK